MKKLLLVFGIALVLILVVAPASMAASVTAAAGEWTWVNTGTVDKVMPVDHGLLEPKAFSGYGTEDGLWKGTFDGTSKDVFHYVVTASGAFLGTLTAYIDGQVNGVAGTVTMRVTFYAAPGSDVMSGHWNICGGGGGLARLRGTGTWWTDPVLERAFYVGSVTMR